jgi:hypothetical protein
MENVIRGINVGLEILIAYLETLVDILSKLREGGLSNIFISGLLPFVRGRGFSPQAEASVYDGLPVEDDRNHMTMDLSNTRRAFTPAVQYV